MSAATGALQPVLGKLGTLLGEEYKRLRSIHAEIKFLTLELKAMDAFLEKMAEEEDPNPQDKHWMNEVRELSYDVEDNLDEFMARVVAGKSAKPDGFMDKIKGSLKRVKARHEIAKAIEDLKKQAIEVSQRNARYRSGETGASDTNSVHKVDLRALAIFEDASKLIGVDEPKREIIQLLGDSEASKHQPNVVAIVGSGGLGKTTVANRVYQELKDQFNYHAFLSVSRNPDIASVMSNIYGQLNEHYSPCEEILQTIITKIRDFLENKRYLIVVDDIWKEDHWKVIKLAFPETSSGSKIITTSRNKDVAESCCSTSHGHIYNLRPLTMMQSRQLFYTRLFNSEEECPSDLKEISVQILEKCAGLPLAIIAISGVLADKISRKDQWRRVKDSIGRALRNSSVETIISLSYLDLPPHLRTCLLYLSIFPEDHIINKDNLIRRWIGEGFIHQQKGPHRQGDPTPYELGEKCFTDLINRSLIQPAEIDGSFGGNEVDSCRVHDMVLDFVVAKAVEENFVTIIGVPGVVNPDPENNKVRRLSLQKDGEIPPGLVLSHARSLHVFGGSVKIPSLSEFQLLRVLDYEECGQLEDDNLAGIGDLLHLKYLRFRNAHSVTELPKELARLQHLEIDIAQDYRHTEGMKIPEIVRNQLGCYVTVFADYYEALPDEIADTQGLRVLENLSVYNQSIEFLEGLGMLKNLRKLGIHFESHYADDDWEEQQEAAVLSLWQLGGASLESLYLFIKDEDADYNEGPILEEEWFSCPPCGIRELVIDGYSLTTFPEWLESFDKLEKLSLPVSDIGEKGVEILGALPSLSYLIIKWATDSDGGEEMEAATRRAMEAHPNRPTLVWRYW